MKPALETLEPFFESLFDQSDVLRAANIPDRSKPVIDNRLLKRDSATAHCVDLLEQFAPNLYFGASAMDGKGFVCLIGG